MLTLKQVVTIYFPQEKILNSGMVKIERRFREFGNFRLPTPTPVPFLETGQKFYFDERGYNIKISQLAILISPVIASLFLLILVFLFKAKFSLGYVYIGVGAGITAAFVGLITSRTMHGISLVEKSWIEKKFEENEWTIIQGQKPSGISYFMDEYLYDQKVHSLPLVEKMAIIILALD